eukprot:GEMP01026562.1.p1 GENE.GEMP01026562.1~~GEMP01026562.1.p1  ORF type:complete len:667 (+),score=216.91 GEMP01026562.1:17-2017(+)
MADLDLFGADARDERDTTLKVNEKFARKYDKRKDLQDLVRAKQLLDDEGSSSSEDDDDNAELLTPHVDGKILETLCAIKNKDPSIYDPAKTFFDEKDFERRKIAEAKKITYNDLLRETLLKDGAEAFVNEDDEVANKKGPQDDNARAELIKAAHEDDEDSDGDLFVKKHKGAVERAAEDANFKEFSLRQKEDDMAVLASKYWRPDEELDENEQFLRDYILKEGWKEGQGMQVDLSDRESESDHLDQVDDFEREYNFRFEEAGGTQIVGHDRNVLHSVRQKDDKRKRKRLEREERKLEEKVRRDEELKRLKNLKKKEIADRLKKLQEITGNEYTNINLQDDFDPDAHDADMKDMLGENYDEQAEKLNDRELVNAYVDEDEKKWRKENWDADWIDEDWEQDTWCEDKAGNAEDNGEENADADAHWEDGTDDNDELGPDENTDDLWYLCDACQLGIQAGQRLFVCKVCDDFVLCRKCFRGNNHPHRFNRKKVPVKCVPPEDWVPGDAATSSTAPVEAQEVSDEYYKMDYEDIIGGDLPTRFNYVSVPQSTFGLDAKEILSLSEKELNKKCGLKRMTRPYWELENSSGKKHRRNDAWRGAGDANNAEKEHHAGHKEWHRNQNHAKNERKTDVDETAAVDGTKENAKKPNKKLQRKVKKALTSERAAAYGL